MVILFNCGDSVWTWVKKSPWVLSGALIVFTLKIWEHSLVALTEEGGDISHNVAESQDIFYPGLKSMACGRGRNESTFSSVQFSRSVMSDSLRSHELQYARPPCPSRNPGIHPNSCWLSRWCQPPISSSVIPVSSCPQSPPATESFPMSQFFSSGGQTIWASHQSFQWISNTDFL